MYISRGRSYRYARVRIKPRRRLATIILPRHDFHGRFRINFWLFWLKLRDNSRVYRRYRLPFDKWVRLHHFQHQRWKQFAELRSDHIKHHRREQFAQLRSLQVKCSRRKQFAKLRLHLIKCPRRKQSAQLRPHHIKRHRRKHVAQLRFHYEYWSVLAPHYNHHVHFDPSYGCLKPPWRPHRNEHPRGP